MKSKKPRLGKKKDTNKSKVKSKSEIKKEKRGKRNKEKSKSEKEKDNKNINNKNIENEKKTENKPFFMDIFKIADLVWDSIHKDKSNIQENYIENDSPIKFYFFKDLINENLGLCSKFITFKSIKGILLIIYTTDDYSIISYDIVNEKKQNEIKCSQKDIFELYHCLDRKNKRDLLLTQSTYNYIKIWDIENFNCILDLKKLELNYTYISKTCFMNFKNEIYIIIGNTNEPFKFYNLSGDMIKEIKFDKDINYIYTYNDDELSKVYIIISRLSDIISYDYENGKIYNQYFNIERGYIYNLLLVKNNESGEATRIFGNYGSYLNIWNFDTGELLKNIRFNYNVNNICLWNNQFLIGITEIKFGIQNSLCLLDLKNGKISENLISYEKCNPEFLFFKIMHPKYGEGLIIITKDKKIKLLLIEKK